MTVCSLGLWNRTPCVLSAGVTSNSVHSQIRHQSTQGRGYTMHEPPEILGSAQIGSCILVHKNELGDAAGGAGKAQACMDE